MRRLWRRRRMLVLAALALPLLAAGTCVQMADRAVINGYFDALTSALVEQAKTQLGLT